jgi:hypothetical protein
MPGSHRPLRSATLLAAALLAVALAGCGTRSTGPLPPWVIGKTAWCVLGSRGLRAELRRRDYFPPVERDQAGAAVENITAAADQPQVPS